MTDCLSLLQLCAIIVEKQEDIAAFKDYTDTGDESPTPQKASEEQKSSPAKADEKPKHDAPSKTDQPAASAPKKEESREKKAASNKGSRVIASPLARKLAEEKGIQLDVSTAEFPPSTTAFHLCFSRSKERVPKVASLPTMSRNSSRKEVFERRRRNDRRRANQPRRIGNHQQHVLVDTMNSS